MWIVQRSPSSSADREIGQYWPYVFMRHLATVQYWNWTTRAREVLAEQ